MNHMNKAQIKQLNKLITHPLAEMLVGDVVRTLEEANGTYPESDESIARLAKAVIEDLKDRYKQQIEQIGKGSKVKNRDLYELIDSIKSGKEPEFINKINKK